MVADTKKCQTMVNVAAAQIVIIRAAIATLSGVRDTFLVVNPDVTGTPLEGYTAAMNNALNALDDTVNTTHAATWDHLIANYVPTHRGKALEE
jgi:hypothetical protein